MNVVIIVMVVDFQIEFFHRTAWRRETCNASNRETELVGSLIGPLSINNATSNYWRYYCTDFNIAENWETRSNIVVYDLGSSTSSFTAMRVIRYSDLKITSYKTHMVLCRTM